MSKELKESIVAFVDILGFKKLLENEEDAKNLFEVIKNIKNQNTPESRVEYMDSQMKLMPTITSFSDCIVFSIPLEKIIQPFDLGHAVNDILNMVQQLADSLMTGGYVLRGGITKGDIYHNDGIVFGSALIEAHDLESTKAKIPRILVSDKLAEEYNESKYDACNFLSKDDVNKEKTEYYLDYLKFSFQYSPNREKYKKNTEKTIKDLKKNIIEKIHNDNFNQLEKDLEILEKWIFFEKHIIKAISFYE